MNKRDAVIRDPRITVQQGRISDERLYTLAEIEQLAKEWLSSLGPAGEADQWRLTTFFAWVAHREREG